MFDLIPFLRALFFSAIYAGVEYRYVNRREAAWTKSIEGFYESAAWSKYTPYHLLFLLPIIIVVGHSFSISAWAGNVFFAAFAEDLSYFVWRGRWIIRGEWTTQLFGSFGRGGFVLPVWWPLDVLLFSGFYLVPWT